MTLWKPAGKMDCVDLGKDFFLIRFTHVEDCHNVMERGPWFIGEHFLTIRPWEPNFRPSTADPLTVAVWVWFTGLPMKYYEAPVLKGIGQAIGRVLRIDTCIASESRDCYARLCSQVDLEKPLISTIPIGELEQAVECEGLNMLCFSCGRIGLHRGTCQYTVREQTLEVAEAAAMSRATEEEQSSCEDPLS